MKKAPNIFSTEAFRFFALTAVLAILLRIIMNDPEGVLFGFLKSFGW
ncbi:hypothetical protein H8S90_15330 [Olivibacter sp. SDN3]|nr:hypothetical protein [Olivibacter sp. SDN3]QNL48172.1 hypothetical protein H8S90_15330 [Olivibacter sp. SDN3]